MKNKGIWTWADTRSLDGSSFTPEDVYKYMIKHSRFIDRLNKRKLCNMYNESFYILLGQQKVKDSVKDNWKFKNHGYFDEDLFEWND